MRTPFEIFTLLGERLSDFGISPHSKRVIAEAIEANPWFTEEDILHAVGAIRHDMLYHETLCQWLLEYRAVQEPKDVAVIMAGNIPLVGFNDLLCVIAIGHRCHVKTSSKDSILMRYIIDELKAIEPETPIYDYSSKRHYDMAIATGGEEANRYFRDHFMGTRTLLRSSRHSLAILDGHETTKELEGLTRDITLYSGLGCRSVSMLMLPRGYDVKLPECKAVNPKLEHNLRTMRALMTMQGKSFRDQGGYLMVESHDFPTPLATVAVCYYDDLESVEQWITKNREAIQCVVSHIDIEGAVPFGHAQRPTLWDYADGVNTLDFLLND